MPRRFDWGLSEKRWPKSAGEDLRPAKTVWDWLQLVAVPLVLAVLAFGFALWQSSRDSRREEHQAQRDRSIARTARLDDVLQSYLDGLSKLIVNNDLLLRDENARTVARAQTLVALRRLDGARRGEVIRALADAALIAGGREPFDSDVRFDPIVSLESADLRGVDLRGVNLVNVSLAGTDLRGARFDGARLESDDLSSSRIQHAHFERAGMFAVDFHSSRLDHAHFDGSAFISSVAVDGANAGKRFRTGFRNACISAASFRDVEIASADVSLANSYGKSTDFARAQVDASALRGAQLREINLEKAKVVGSLPSGWNRRGVIARWLEYVCGATGRPWPGE